MRPDREVRGLLKRFAAGNLELVLAVNSAARAVPATNLSEPYFVSALGVFARKGDVFLGDIGSLYERRVIVKAGGFAETWGFRSRRRMVASSSA